jgi:pilus assembly protein CpaB
VAGWSDAWQLRRQARILVALLLGVIALVLMWMYVKGQEASLLQLSAMKDVLVAGRNIRANTLIDEGMLLSRKVPSVYVQPTAISDPKAVLGRIAAVPIPQGAQILGSYLEEAGRRALAADIPRGQRAFTIAVSDVTGVGGLVRPGNFVDIFGTFQLGRPLSINPQGQMQYAEQRTETRLLMPNVLVVAIGREQLADRRFPRRPAQGAEGDDAAAEEPPSDQTVNNVTLLVGPRQVQELILAQEIGTLTLALRSTLDEGIPADLGPLDPLGLLKVPIPPIPKARPWWRELRGPS